MRNTSLILALFLPFSLSGQCKFFCASKCSINQQKLSSFNFINNTVHFFGFGSRLGVAVNQKHLLIVSSQTYLVKDNTAMNELKLYYWSIVNPKTFVASDPKIEILIVSEQCKKWNADLLGSSFAGNLVGNSSFITPKLEVGFGVSFSKLNVNPFIET
jgi:hypothetical protein